MKNWLSWLPLKNNLPRWLVISGFTLALIGFSDAGYLSMKLVQGQKPKCFITTGCDTVTSSRYSKIGPFPVTVLGLFFYTTMLVLFFSSLESGKTWGAEHALFITPLGFLFTMYFLFVQTFVLKAYCVYCLMSAATSTALFGLAVYHWVKK